VPNDYACSLPLVPGVKFPHLDIMRGDMMAVDVILVLQYQGIMRQTFAGHLVVVDEMKFSAKS
jgi:hypothetical protein